ncbi:MAG: hypothetical protein R2720_03690 [Candidatus Nanopelagicales bacterium]
MKLRSLAIAVGILGLLGATAPASAQPASSQLSSNSCSKLLKKAKKAKKSGKAGKSKRLQKRYRTCKKTLKHERTVTKAISGYTFTGTRGDGRRMNLTFCPDGKWISYETNIRYANRGTSWYVRHVAYSSSTKWVTQVGENKDRYDGGFGIGLARDGDSFQVGIASFDTVTDLGPATRTSGADMCATL